MSNSLEAKIVVLGSQGVGKTSLSRRLVADHADMELSTSWTTRPARPGEQHEREYYFVDRPAFDAKGADIGFAAFGRVIEGQEVVKAILASPVSPTTPWRSLAAGRRRRTPRPRVLSDGRPSASRTSSGTEPVSSSLCTSSTG